MRFDKYKALSKAIKGMSTAGVAGAVAAGIVFGFGDSIAGVPGNEAVLVAVLTGFIGSLFELARNTWKHRNTVATEIVMPVSEDAE